MAYDDVRNFLNTRHTEVKKLGDDADRSATKIAKDPHGRAIQLDKAMESSAVMKFAYSYWAIARGYEQATKNLKPDNCDQVLRDLLEYFQTRSDIKPEHYRVEESKISAFISPSMQPR